MRDLELGRLLRALRRRRGWRQEDCAVRARVHRSTWSNLERGRLERMTFGTVRRCLAVLEVVLDLRPRWRGADVDRLLDEEHAALQSGLAERLRRWGWTVFVEVSFNHYGDRGRIDLLAWLPRLRILLVVEVKSDVPDSQALLGPLDVKVRVAGRVAAELGLGRPALVLPLLLVPDDPTIRRRIERLAPLFSRFSLRGRTVATLLRAPDPARFRAESGLLLFSNRSYATGSRVKRIGRVRVRRSGGAPRTNDDAGGARVRAGRS